MLALAVVLGTACSIHPHDDDSAPDDIDGARFAAFGRPAAHPTDLEGDGERGLAAPAATVELPASDAMGTRGPTLRDADELGVHLMTTPDRFLFGISVGAPGDVASGSGQEIVISAQHSSETGLWGAYLLPVDLAFEDPARAIEESHILELSNGNNQAAQGSGDLSGDGRPDLVLTTQWWSGPEVASVLLGPVERSSEPFTIRGQGDRVCGYRIRAIIGDFSGDGRPDLVLNCAMRGAVTLLEGPIAGDTTVGYSNPSIATSPEAARHPFLEFVTALDGSSEVLIAGPSDEMYSACAYRFHSGWVTEAEFEACVLYEGEIQSALSLGDVNADGYPDVAVSHTSNGYYELDVHLNWHGAPAGHSFPDASIVGHTRDAHVTGHMWRAGDADRDGRDDLAIHTGHPYEPATIRIAFGSELQGVLLAQQLPGLRATRWEQQLGALLHEMDPPVQGLVEVALHNGDELLLLGTPGVADLGGAYLVPSDRLRDLR